MKKIVNFLFVLTFLATLGSCGKEGAIGPQGDKGDKGEIGAQGIPGTDGQMLLYGNRSPTTSDGKEGDFFIDKSSNNLYGPKANGSWGSGTSLKGDAGSAGPKGDTGAAGPKGDSGSKGDTGTKGDTGATGPKGDTGTKGDTGAKGADGINGSQFHSGTGIPTTIGVVSDFYFDTSDSKLYGPKTSSGWGTGISLKGEKGDTGDTGPRGPKGDDGVDGNANVQKFKFYIDSADWGGGHFGDGNHHAAFTVTPDLTGGISIGSADYLPLAYIAPVQEGGDSYSEQKAVPYIMSMRVDPGEEEYGIRYELLPNRQYITMSKTTNGFNSLSMGTSRYPKRIYVTIILVKYSLVSKLKDQVDFNDLKAVSNYFNL